MRKYYPLNLEVKIIILIIPVLLLILLIGGVLLHTFIADIIYEQSRISTMEILETIELSLHHSLMENDFEEVQQVILNTGQQGRTEAVRMFTLDGEILASSVPGETGVSLKKESEQCQCCHTTENGDSPLVKRAPALGRDGEVLVTVTTIENRVACQGCHGEEAKTLGLILAEHPIAPVDDRVDKLGLEISGAGAVIFVAISAVLIIILRRQVGLPLRRLVVGDIENDLTERKDDIGRLASRLVETEETLIAQNELLSFQRRSFNALLSISETAGEDPSVKRVVQNALETLREATDFVSIGMRLYDENSRCFRLIAHYGISPAMFEVLECIPEDQGFQSQAYRTKRPVYTSDMTTASNLVGRTVLDLDYRSLICVPLIAGDQVLGTMELVTDQEHIWRENEVRWLALFGRSIGVLIRNVQLTNRLRDMTVLQERSRLAQEIHDGLAQLIGSIRLWAEEAQISLEEKKFASLEIALDKIEHTARDAYSSIREEMLGLRDTVVPGENLVAVVTEYLSRFQRQWGIETKLFYQDGDGRADTLSISPTAEIQLLRIIQESLTNVRRHADATRIVVTIEELADSVSIVIQDDGRGFYPEQISDENLGLNIMRERAASVGGSIQVISEPGQGTEINIEIPS